MRVIDEIDKREIFSTRPALSQCGKTKTSNTEANYSGLTQISDRTAVKVLGTHNIKDENKLKGYNSSFLDVICRDKVKGYNDRVELDALPKSAHVNNSHLTNMIITSRSLALVKPLRPKSDKVPGNSFIGASIGSTSWPWVAGASEVEADDKDHIKKEPTKSKRANVEISTCTNIARVECETEI